MNRKHRRPPQGAPTPKPQGWKERFVGWWELIIGWCGRIENACMAAARMARYDRIPVWFSAYFHPEQAHAQEENASLRRIIADLIMVYFLYALVNFLAGAYFLYGSESSMAAMREQGYAIPPILVFAISALIASPLVNLMVWFAIIAVAFLSAKLLGGRGSFVPQASALSRIFCGSSLLLAVLAVPIFIITALIANQPNYSIPGIMIMAAGFAVMLAVFLSLILIIIYTLYGYFAAIREVHSLASWRAFLVLALVFALALAANTAFGG